MPNEYFDWPSRAASDRFVRFDVVRSADMNDALDDLSNGLAKLPTPAQLWSQRQNYAVATGAVNAWSASIAAAYLTALVDGMQVRVKFPASNTTTTPTLNLNGLGAKPIVAYNTGEISSGFIEAGISETLTYNAAADRWHLLKAPNNSAASGVSYGASNVADALDSIILALDPIGLASYDDLRAYDGSETRVNITGYLASSAPAGIAGLFVRDDTDTTTADNGATVIVDASGRRWKRAYDGYVDARWFSVSSSSSDNATALQNAVNAAQGKTLVLPAGTLVSNSRIQGLSNVRVVGQGRGKTILDFSAAPIDAGGGAFQDSAIYCDGTLGAAVPATVSLAVGSASVLCDSAHGLVANDWALLVGDTTASSANDCLDAAAGEYRLGDDTQVVPFAEIIQVESVSGNTINFRGTNEFPYTTKLNVHKLTPVENFELSHLTVKYGSGLYRMRLRRAMGLKVHHCSFVSDGVMRAVEPEMCWDSDVCDNSMVFAANANTDLSDATQYNGVKLLNGCWAVRVARNTIVNPTQGIDVTYGATASTQAAPNRWVRIEENTVIGASFHAITTHGGNWGARIVGNVTLDCDTGIFHRCRHGQVLDNTCTASNESTASLGIYLGDDGWYSDTTVRGNKIKRHDKGIYVAGNAAAANAKRVKIHDNDIDACAIGIEVANYAAGSTQIGLSITENDITNPGTNAILVGTNCNGVLVEDNTSNGATTGDTISIGSCIAPVLRNNTVISAGASTVPFRIATGCTSWIAAGNVAIGSNGAPAYPATSSSSLLWNNNIAAGSLYLADDAVATISLPSNHCMVTVACFRSAGNGTAYMQASVAGTKLTGHASFAATTGALTGTTGVDGNVTVSIDASGVLYIENRTGFADTFGVHIVASSS